MNDVQLGYESHKQEWNGAFFETCTWQKRCSESIRLQCLPPEERWGGSWFEDGFITVSCDESRICIQWFVETNVKSEINSVFGQSAVTLEQSTNKRSSISSKINPFISRAISQIFSTDSNHANDHGAVLWACRPLILTGSSLLGKLPPTNFTESNSCLRQGYRSGYFLDSGSLTFAIVRYCMEEHTFPRWLYNSFLLLSSIDLIITINLVALAGWKPVWTKWGRFHWDDKGDILVMPSEIKLFHNSYHKSNRPSG